MTPFLYSILFPANDPPTTTEGHRLFATTRCCNYSLFELLMMGESFAHDDGRSQTVCHYQML
jgi:hypothetical protein